MHLYGWRDPLIFGLKIEKLNVPYCISHLLEIGSVLTTFCYIKLMLEFTLKYSLQSGHCNIHTTGTLAQRQTLKTLFWTSKIRP